MLVLGGKYSFKTCNMYLTVNLIHYLHFDEMETLLNAKC